MHRIVEAMQRLRDAGNTLVVVEHDPAVMLAADRLIDMGPGPGERGGRIVFDGDPDGAKLADTLTGAYLGARKQVGMGIRRAVNDSTPRLILQGASEHNLRDVTVEFPLQRLVVVTGVSGSGKSTLMQDVLFPALECHFGKPTETPGKHEALLGADWLAEAVFVDQSPIGKTARSNPASYVGAFDEIRKLFATTPVAVERNYGAGMFSFNAGDGRCPTCGGSGFEHVEMQFLSDVYLRCPDCDGRRFRAEMLDAHLVRRDRQLSVADVLELTVSEAVQLFAEDREVIRRLQPIVDVGLDYVKLGQPVPTLSGGEAQRLKLAGFLAEAAQGPQQPAAKKGTLFLFDEPTTGLHFDDIAKLMRSLRRLLEAGHSLIVIEHNLDVIRSADWLVDLGPEGGEAGGELVGVGTPEDLKANPRSHTGRALRDYEETLGLERYAPAQAQREAREKQARYAAAEVGRDATHDGPSLQSLVSKRRRASGAANDEAIRIVNAREHNLKDVDVEIPRGRFSVVTGVSGSGKSTLAFDILFNEGQRRYLESLNAYARQFVQPAARPDLDAIHGIPPTVAIEQRASRGGLKSTVATLTELYHFLRLLYVKLGTQYCPDCDVAIEPQSPASIAARLLRDYRGRRIALLAPLIVARKGYYTDLARWAAKKGFRTLRVDGERLPTSPWPRLSRFREHTIELPVAEVDVSVKHEAATRLGLARALDFGKGLVHVLPQEAKRVTVFSTRRACPSCGQSFAELDPRLFSFNSRHGWCESCYGTGVEMPGFDEQQSGEELWWNEWYAHTPEPCGSCQGQRLNPTALSVRFRGRSIAALAGDSVAASAQFFARLRLGTRERQIARDLLAEIRARLKFLERVGLGYLQLDRAAPTLSGGEAQRIRLAAQLGSNLQGVCYVLDEPTIGLHPRDNATLLETLERLRSKGNTLVVVEHDEDTIRRADHVIDLGPGAGVRGGEVVAQGSARELAKLKNSATGRCLAEPLTHSRSRRRPISRSTPK